MTDLLRRCPGGEFFLLENDCCHLHFDFRQSRRGDLASESCIGMQQLMHAKGELLGLLRFGENVLAGQGSFNVPKIENLLWPAKGKLQQHVSPKDPLVGRSFYLCAEGRPELGPLGPGGNAVSPDVFFGLREEGI